MGLHLYQHWDTAHLFNSVVRKSNSSNFSCSNILTPRKRKNFALLPSAMKQI